MNDLLVAYLDAIDERLLDYLDEDDELSLDTVHRLRLYASELLTGLITPAHLIEDWPDWFHLAPAFVAAYAEELAPMEERTTLFDVVGATEDGKGVNLTDADRGYLTALAAQLDMYPEMRNVGEDKAGE